MSIVCSPEKTLPTFQRDHIKAMSPTSQYLADLLEREGWIKIVDDHGEGDRNV